MPLAALQAPASAVGPVRFDTDVGNDVDDALALAMIHALESRGEAKLLAVTITKDNRWAAPYVDLVNHFYGRGQVPIGVVKNGMTPADSPMIRIPAERKLPNDKLVYPRRIMDGRTSPEAVGLLRKTLAAEKDGSVVIVQVGFSTNLVRLLDSEVPAKTQESDAMSKDLKRRGFKFVGSTICYAFMQAVGMVNDHLVDCFRHGELR